MTRLRIGLRCEDKPFECRAGLVPDDVRTLIHRHAIDCTVEPSDQRAFGDDAYRRAGASIGSLRGIGAKVIVGLKEIPEQAFEPDTVYLFWAHVLKGQPHNMPMLRSMLANRVTLIDYERILDAATGRPLDFSSKWAGRAGMAETLRLLGLRLAAEGHDSNPLLQLKPAYEYPNLADLKRALTTIGGAIARDGMTDAVTPLAIGFIGDGNVSRGAQEIFDVLPHRRVEPDALAGMKPDPHTLVKVVFREQDTVCPTDDTATFDLQDYYANGAARYRSQFSRYLPYLTGLINGIVWTDTYPRLVTRTDIQRLWAASGGRPRLRIVGDVSCDIGGGIEFTAKATTPAEPAFVYDPQTDRITDDCDAPGIVVMAVDNLPSELGRDASIEHSRLLSPLLPPIIRADYSVAFDDMALPPEITNAIIVHRGNLTPRYEYLAQKIG